MNMRITYGNNLIMLNGDMSMWIKNLDIGTATSDVEQVATRIELVLLGSQSAVQDSVSTINKYLEYAKQAWINPYLQKVYLEVYDESVWWRSQIVEGSFDIPNGYYDRLARNKVPNALLIQRLNFWEGAEVAVPLTNLNGTDVTTGITVYNCNDNIGTSPNVRCNYVMISSTYVTGELPTPPRIEITNTSNSTEMLYKVWVGAHQQESGFTWNFEAENTIGTEGTNTANNNCSNGYYRNFTVSIYEQIELLRFTLSSFELNSAAGQWYKVLARFTNRITYNDLRMQTSLYIPPNSHVTKIQESQEVLLPANNEIYEIGILQIPPWLPNPTGSNNPIDLVVKGRRPGGFSFGIDYVQLFPVDGYKRLMSINNASFGIAYGSTIIDDGITDSLWAEQAYSRGAYLVGFGEKIYLYPGKQQYMYFLQQSYISSNITRTVSVRVYYRPRRLTI